jgi:hypothetical protein
MPKEKQTVPNKSMTMERTPSIRGGLLEEMSRDIEAILPGPGSQKPKDLIFDDVALFACPLVLGAVVFEAFDEGSIHADVVGASPR